MSSFTLCKSNGEIQEVTYNGLIQRLADTSRLGWLLHELGPSNTLTIELRDGPATIRRGQVGQGRLALPVTEPPDLPMLLHSSNLSLQFSVPAQVKCPARSTEHFKDTVREVVRGHRGIPKGFSLQVVEQALMEVWQSLRDSNFDVIDHVAFDNVTPYHQLPPPAGEPT
jgi:hypothetical protein